MNNYDISVPVFVRGLKNLSKWLDKAEKFTGSETAMAQVVATRLAPDMFSLRGQVQVATEMAKGCGARLGGVEAPVFANDELTVDDLRNRIAKTIAFLEGLAPDAFEQSPKGEISITLPYGVLRFSPQTYVLQFSLPNFFFHITTAYNILRHKGIPLGKMDYLGDFD
jgi:uncharacterized protein